MWNQIMNQLQIKNIHIFISHSWGYDDHYNKVKEWISSAGWNISDYSIPRSNPLDTKTNAQLRNGIIEHIRHASIVIICAGMYDSYSNWIQFEIDTALAMNKPVIAVKPWGNVRIPAAIQNNSDKILVVNWQKDSVISGIRSLL